ncbi:MAG: hypothetical protein L3J74_05760 [Bacteroidales bacterium]|nr:hypothetical protein [Bacteroidales bacterium]
MKYIFIIILFVHGFIHLFGFAKAFGLAQMNQINSEISKLQGAFWFITFVLFSFAGEALFSNNTKWYQIAFLAVFVSVILIVTTWQDTKYGIIPNCIILLIAILSSFSHDFNTEIEKEISKIVNPTEKTVIRKAELASLPYPVSKWLLRTGVLERSAISVVRLKQTAKMKLSKEQKHWYNANAEQYFTIEQPAFIWRVDLSMNPLIKVAGRDKFNNGKGEMLIKLFSAFNVVNEKGKKIDESTMQRYLAEIVWFPSAALNPYIKWQGIDSLSAKATMTYNGTSATGIFYFNKEGDFVKFKCFRYKDNTSDAKKYEWIVDVVKYAEFEGVRVPARTELSWILETGVWTWMILEVSEIHYNFDKQIAKL